MQYEQQKAACAEYAQQNGGSVADVLRVSGRKGAVVLSKDGRTIYDPFVIEPIKEVFTAEPMKEMESAVKERVQEEVRIEIPAQAPKKKAATRKKK
jgi:hypothetical protein